MENSVPILPVLFRSVRARFPLPAGLLLRRHARGSEIVIVVRGCKNILVFNQKILADQRTDSEERAKNGKQQHVAASVVDLQTIARCVVLQTLRALIDPDVKIDSAGDQAEQQHNDVIVAILSVTGADLIVFLRPAVKEHDAVNTAGYQAEKEIRPEASLLNHNNPLQKDSILCKTELEKSGFTTESPASSRIR